MTQVLASGLGMRARKAAELQVLSAAQQQLAQLPVELQERLQGLSVCLHSSDAAGDLSTQQVLLPATACARVRSPEHRPHHAGVGQ